MQSRRQVLSTLALSALSALFVGCGGSEEITTAAPKPDTAEQKANLEAMKGDLFKKKK